MIGYHIGIRDTTPYPIYQTMLGTNQSLYLPPIVPDPLFDKRRFWHAAYIANINPSKSHEPIGNYLHFACALAKASGVERMVVHNGSTKQVNIVEGIIRFIDDWGIDTEVIAIEIGASATRFNQDPTPLAVSLPYCLDLAHSNAAGTGWGTLRRLISKYPPKLVHCNYPGSPFSSGQDRHGWRHNPSLSPRSVLTDEWDETVRLLYSMGIPLIVEGSGFPRLQDEIEFLYTEVIKP